MWTYLKAKVSWDLILHMWEIPFFPCVCLTPCIPSRFSKKSSDNKLSLSHVVMKMNLHYLHPILHPFLSLNGTHEGN